MTREHAEARRRRAYMFDQPIVLRPSIQAQQDEIDRCYAAIREMMACRATGGPAGGSRSRAQPKASE